MHFDKTTLTELSLKYNLPHWAVEEEIEKAVSSILTKRFGCEISALFNNTTESPPSFDIWRFNDKEAQRLLPESIKSSFRELKTGIAYALLNRGVIEEHKRLRDKIRSIACGTIVREDAQTGAIYAELHDMEDNACGKAIAVLKPAFQTPKERGCHGTGDILRFYVMNIQPVYDEDTVRLEISLSRNSKGLAQGLLQEELSGSGIKVKCLKRIAGAFSLIEASKRIPKEVIKKTSDELKERIIVRYGKK